MNEIGAAAPVYRTRHPMAGSHHGEFQYLDLLAECLFEGNEREGRNGKVYSRFGGQMRFDLARGFPILTTKKVHFKSIVAELLWFLSGDTNVKFLREHRVSIWDEWANERGDLGPVYGKQWRDWRGVSSNGKAFKLDQIAEVMRSLRDDPFGRRHVVSAWNPADIPDMALPPCHCLFQFFVTADAQGQPQKLSAQLYQRSADVFLGVPFNIASYALLVHIMAQYLGLEVGDFVHTVGDVHLYETHAEQASTQIKRLPKAFPTLVINNPTLDIGEFKVHDFRLDGYDALPALPAPVSP